MNDCPNQNSSTRYRRRFGWCARPRLTWTRGTESHFLDYARVLYKRRWTVITGFIVAFGVMFTYSSSATPMYTARVQLLIENDSQNVIKFDEVYEPNKTTNDYYQTQYRLLQSRLIARRTIEAEKLWTHPALTGEPAAATPTYLDAIRGSLQLGQASSPGSEAEQRDATENADQAAVVDAFLGSMTVVPVRNSRLVDVSFTNARPAAGLAGRQCDREELHRTESRIQVPGHAGGNRVPQCAHRRTAQEARTERAGAPAIPRKDWRDGD